MKINYKKVNGFHPLVLEKFNGIRKDVINYYDIYTQIFLDGEYIGDVFESNKGWTASKYNKNISRREFKTRKEAVNLLKQVHEAEQI